MGLKVTLTLQMQAPHSDFWCLLAAPAAILCENHNSVFLFLLGTIATCGLPLWNCCKPWWSWGLAWALGCQQSLCKSLASLLRDLRCRLLVCHMFTFSRESRPTACWTQTFAQVLVRWKTRCMDLATWYLHVTVFVLTTVVPCSASWVLGNSKSYSVGSGFSSLCLSLTKDLTLSSSTFFTATAFLMLNTVSCFLWLPTSGLTFPWL